MFAPTDRHIPGHSGATAPALVVVAESSSASQGIELRKEIIVVRAGTAVQHDNIRTVSRGADVQLDAVHFNG